MLILIFEEIDGIEFPTENRKDQLAALALHLRGTYRCPENVINIIFSNLKKHFK